jgi:serine/threonine protein kinase
LENLASCDSQVEEDEEDEVRIVDNYNGVVKINFNFHYVIGKGGFGKVWKVELKKSRIPYAMKEMNKAKIISKRSVNSVMNEK